MSNLNDFWKEIATYGIPELKDFIIDLDKKELVYNQSRTDKKTNWEQTTPQYQTFSININRAAVFLFDIKEIEPKLDKGILNTSFNAKKIFFEHHVKSEAVITLSVTALEVFMGSVFRIASNKLELKKLNSKDLEKFCKTFRLKINKSDILLKDILVDRMDFQNGDNCKRAFKLLGIDLPKIDVLLWQNIFNAKKVGSLMNLRHRIIHTGQKVMLTYEFTYIEVKKTIIDLISFVLKLEKLKNSLNLQDRDIVTIFD